MNYADVRRTGPFPRDASRWRWGKKNLRALHRGESRSLGVPLIPADQHADFAEAGLPRAKPQVARREVKLLVIERVVRNVNFAIHAEQRAVGIDDRGGIMINARAALLEQRDDQHHAAALGQALKRLRRRAGDRLGHGEVFVILALAKILGGEQFLRADNLRPVFRRLFGLGQGGLEIFGGNAGGSGLDQADGDRFFGGWHRVLDAHWPGSREMFAPSARSLPSMFS